MKYFTDQEYIELCQKLVDQQYNDVIDDYDFFEIEYIPEKPEIKEKIIEVNSSGMIDLIHIKSDKIKEEILKYGNLKIGDFKIIISHYNEVLSQDGARLCCNLKIMKHQSQTMNGMPCNMDVLVNLQKDNRFNGRHWLKYFSNSFAYNVPIDTVVEMIRWMQCIKKLSAFL